MAFPVGTCYLNSFMGHALCSSRTITIRFGCVAFDWKRFECHTVRLCHSLVVSRFGCIRLCSVVSVVFGCVGCIRLCRLCQSVGSEKGLPGRS